MQGGACHLLSRQRQAFILPETDSIFLKLDQTSMRLAGACQIHNISPGDIAYQTQCFVEGRLIPDPGVQSRRIISSPRDGIELGERVWAFWSAFSESTVIAR